VTHAEHFREVVARVREAENRYACPEVGQLYEMVLREARSILASFRKDLGPDGIDDLASDFLSEKLGALVEAENPAGFLKIALYHRACSMLRRKDAKLVELTERHADQAVGADGATPLQFLELQELRLALNTLSVRDRQIVLAVGEGEDPDEVAAAFGTTRANVYQIVCRFRRDHKREAP